MEDAIENCCACDRSGSNNQGNVHRFEGFDNDWMFMLSSVWNDL